MDAKNRKNWMQKQKKPTKREICHCHLLSKQDKFQIFASSRDEKGTPYAAPAS